MSYRPSQEFNPITWTGDITTPKPPPRPRRPRPRRRADRRRRILRRPRRRVHNGAHDRPRAPRAAPRLAARGHARGARADGRDHQRGLPPAVRGAGRRPLRLRDDHLARHRRARRDHAADADLRRDRDGPLGAALRHRPGLRRQGRRDPVRRARRGAHRPELRLPGAQGDPQGRRRRAARGSAACSARSSRPRSGPPSRTTSR